MSSGYKCYNCGKGIMVGHNVSHAKNRTRKVFRPNLHGAKIVVGGTAMKVRLCTKCLRIVKGRDTRSVKALKNTEISTSAPIAAALV